MILSGWTQPISVENNKAPVDNGASTSTVSETSFVVSQDDDELQILPTHTKKRKLSEVSGASSSNVSASTEAKIRRKAEDIVGENNEVVMLDGGNSGNHTEEREK